MNLETKPIYPVGTSESQKGKYVVRIGIWSEVYVHPRLKEIQIRMYQSEAQTPEEAVKEMLADIEQH